MNRPAAASPRRTAGLVNSGCRRGDDDRPVEGRHGDLDGGLRSGVSELPVEDGFAYEVIRLADPNMRAHRAARVELTEEAAHRLPGVGRRDLVAVLAVDLLG